MTDEVRADKASTILLWLFPVTYLIHVAEEYWGGGGFSAYVARTRGINLSSSRFLLMNGIGVLLMSLGVVLSRHFGFTRWLLVCYGMIAAGNGLSHTITTVITREYNPGLVSGLFVWIPLGLITLRHVKGKMAPRKFWTALALGVGILGVVALLTMSGGKV